MGYFELKKSDKKTTQPYYFVLKASNGETIATSEMYSSKQSALNGIASVQKNGSTTDIRDESSEEQSIFGACKI
ncbi:MULTISPECIES: YegP family protein [unclassified Shewanella]|uniref:YegP family protein n=1 Tax=unclassified Shewanella TaxID=196818 RepID=UPI0021D810C5|nr:MULTISPECIES: YegP family protein [unclassified Shewanella]MCU8005702.1 YegP family protein [Shewanella sp. SM96]MCU8061163.1 YegP family protein [Shewanella sp. SM55]